MLVCLLLIASTLAVYWQLWHQEFINFDDDYYVTNNPYLQRGLTLEGIAWAFTDIRQATLWHPLTWLSLLLDHHFYGLNAGGYKISNLLLHVSNTLLLLMLLYRMTGKLWRCAFVAAMFALHPLHVESVAWVTERKDVLSTFFWLLTAWFYLRYADHPGIKRYLLVVLTFALGLMAKPMLVTLPIVLLLIDYWPLNRFPHPRDEILEDPSIGSTALQGKSTNPVIRLVLEKLPLICLAVAVSLVTIIAQAKGGALLSLALPIKVRIANGMVSYISYIGKTIWPQSLSMYYPHPLDTLPMWKIAGAALLLIAITTVAVRARRKRPYLIVGWLWYLISLLPVIGLFQVGMQAMADRFTYVPGIGLFIIIAWGATDLLSGWRHRQITLSLMAGVSIAGAIILSWSQVQLWQNERTLYEHTLRVTKNNWIIETNLGASLLKIGKIDEATLHFSEALRISPDLVAPLNHLGFILLDQGKYQEASEHFLKIIQAQPYNAKAHAGLGKVLQRTGRLEEATEHLLKAVQINPYNVEAYNDLGGALIQQGRVQEAADYFSKLLQIFPDSVVGHNNMGVTLAQLGKMQEAGEHFSEALRIKPDSTEARNNLEFTHQQINGHSASRNNPPKALIFIF